MRKSATGSEKIHEALELLKQVSREKRVELTDVVSSLYDKAREAQEAATEKVKAAAAKVDDSAHEKPWIYVGGAALLGVLIGLFIRSRRD